MFSIIWCRTFGGAILLQILTSFTFSGIGHVSTEPRKMYFVCHCPKIQSFCYHCSFSPNLPATQSLQTDRKTDFGVHLTWRQKLFWFKFGCWRVIKWPHGIQLAACRWLISSPLDQMASPGQQSGKKPWDVRMIHSVSSPALQDGQINLLSDKRRPQAVNSLISAQQQELSNETDTLIIVSPLLLTYLYVSFKFSSCWLCFPPPPPPPTPESQSHETFKNDCNCFRQMACQIKNALSLNLFLSSLSVLWPPLSPVLTQERDNETVSGI